MTENQKTTRSRVTANDYVDADVAEETQTGEGSDISIDEFERLISESIDSFVEGEPVQGIIIAKSEDHVIVDIGFKSEGVIPLHEFGAQANDLQVG